MPKILFVNSVFPDGSTGNIIKNISNYISKKGFECYYAYSCGKERKSNEYIINSRLDIKLSILQTRILGRHGFYNVYNTKKLIKWIDQISPDIIHLHNIHGHYINVKILFDYICYRNIQVVWTMHDCWAFTGHCAHYEAIECNKWINGCNNCKGLKQYPITYFIDPSLKNWEVKKKIFTNYKDIKIVAPSNWLLKQLKNSFFKYYDLRLINNGIDFNNFYPNKYFRQENLIVLGFVDKWKHPKNKKIIDMLNGMLPENTQLVLVGDKNWSIEVSIVKNAIRKERIADIKQMQKLYSSMDIFINLTREDTFPTVNIESLACGTPVITTNVGGSPEIITDETGMIIDEYTDIKKFVNYYMENREIVREKCVKRAKDNFDKLEMQNQYYNLYKEILKI